MAKTLEIIRDHRGIVTIPEMLARSARDFGPRRALSVFRDGAYQHITFEELWNRAVLLARALKALGVGRGDRCAILGPNSPEWAQAFLGVATAGAICVPIDSLLKPYEFRHILEEAKVKVIFVAKRFLDTILEINEDYHFKKIILLEDLKIEGLSENVAPFSSFLAEGKGVKDVPSPPGLDDIASLIYTSGTTGKAKGVMLTHRNIISDVAVIYQSVDFGLQDRVLLVLPMHHTFACTASFLLPLYAGAQVTFARSLKSRDIIADLKASRTTVMLGVPLLFQKIYEGIMRAVNKAPLSQRTLLKGFFKMVEMAARAGKEEELAKVLFAKLREKAGFGHLRFFVSGGAPLPPLLSQNFRKIGIKIIQGYGLTEASPVLTLNPPEAPRDGSIGLPLPGVEVKIVDPNREGVGDLCFRGPMIMKGYFENPTATSKIIDEEGFLHTGDLGYQDENGYLYICGRAKNLIVTPAGKNVYPEEVEFAINRSPFVLESMVYGIPTQRGGEEVAAVIVPDYEAIDRHFGKHLSEEDVREIIAKELRKSMKKIADYKRVKRFVIWDEELPKTSTRKIKRHLVLPTLLGL